MWWALALSLGCGSDVHVHPVAGVIREVGASTVVIDHEPIPDVMPAMVMELPAPADEVAALAPGDRVEAELLIGGGPTRLRGIRVVGRAEAPPAPAPARDWDDSLLVGEVLERLEVPTTGGPVVIGEGQGRTTVVTFLFTTCPVPEFCPLLATKLAALQPRLGDARIVAITLDPEHDTLEVLRAWGERFGADPERWVFGRLERDALERLLARVDLETARESGTLTHNLRLLVLDREGRLVHREKDNLWEPEKLAGVVRDADTGRSPGPDR